jgi:hypothetical protein
LLIGEILVTNDSGPGDFGALAANVSHDVEMVNGRKLRSNCLGQIARLARARCDSQLWDVEDEKLFEASLCG